MPRASVHWHAKAAREFAEKMSAGGKLTAIKRGKNRVGTSFAVPGTDFTVHFLDANFRRTLPENHFLYHDQDNRPSIAVTETRNRFKQRAVFPYSGVRWKISVPNHMDEIKAFVDMLHAAYHAMRKHASLGTPRRSPQRQ